MTRSIKLNNGDFPIVSRVVDGPELVAQKIEVRLKTFRGEWPLDTDAGMDYVGYGDTTEVPLATIQNDLRTEIEGVNGVLDITNLQVSFDNENRRITVTVDVRLEAGGALELQALVDPFEGGEPTFRYLILPNA